MIAEKWIYLENMEICLWASKTLKFQEMDFHSDAIATLVEWQQENKHGKRQGEFRLLNSEPSEFAPDDKVFEKAYNI